ncbi:MAG: hypothetical protein Q4C85_09190 [Actinomyces sp.]|uniref:hypothetical protein n=1 Tax=Actinomyces sp. TaxID=29317 RepID=UPI0026DCE13B|nr:hypothetical protein [Actinomyces sp.]MDO4243911.1 hypothetical protein [Actinomyces sp.]
MHTLTPRLARAALLARLALIDAASHGEVLTYGELSEAIGGTVLPRHMGPLLHMVGHDCAGRGEPSLPALVVSAGTGEVGTPDSSWAPPERRACWRFWACPVQSQGPGRPEAGPATGRGSVPKKDSPGARVTRG